MANLDTLQLVLRQAERERDQAQALMLQAQARANQARAQAQDLHRYQGEYDARWHQQFQHSNTGIETLQNYRRFGDRLGEAIAQQGQLATVLEGRLDLARQALQDKEMRVAAIRKLIERRWAEAQRLAARQEQKANDEFGQRRLGAPGAALRP
ncbi:MAG: flagellar export protein FliJ [Inhella sp.]|jgi:flagellar FliJ protein|uniref:flagellar export protein FliJ n=1 Tax=Inhella sp. TaxID=1921806 RepID=UPI0022C9E58D|nr:flagellar export protein FliJ [Inhella sp.]MCZ8234539.1 flagellar export protein FliJ [Inhella sp.]